MKRVLSTGIVLALLCASLDAYVLIGIVWPDGSVVMQLQLLDSGGTLADGSANWNQSAEAALAAWNQYLSRLQFRVVRDSTAPIGSLNGYNNVFWSSTVYGTAFDRGAIAVTTQWSRGSTWVESDTIFNTAYSWNSYTGPLTTSSSGGTLLDFRRVALHEFGHTLGLDHPDQYGQVVNAIMNSRISNTYQLQPDDIAGVGVLYGGSAPTVTSPGPPSGLVVGAVGQSVSLAWRAPTTGGTPSAYIIEAGSVSGAVNLANFSTGNALTSFSAGGVGGGTYYVRVRASNAAGTSAPSNEAILIVGGGCSGAPGPPGLLLGSASGSTVTLQWSPSSGAPTSYVVEAGSAPGLSNLANSDLGSAVPSLVAPNIGRGIYYVRVRGKNACGIGPASNEITVVVM